MNTVISKPRAKAERKTKESQEQKWLAGIQSRLQLGAAKLHLAHESAAATDLGTPLEVLLNFITNSMLPGTMAQLSISPLTQQRLDDAYTGMFPILAALQGAISLASGAVIESTLREAHDLLDAGNSDMDTPHLVQLLPQQADTTEADFLRGRDIAVMMLREGYGFRDSDETAGKRWYRGGKPQQRFAKGYLQDILKEPALLDGFAAVLSAAIGEDCFDDFEGYGTLPMAEFQAGEVGADGTLAEESEPVPTALSSNETSLHDTSEMQEMQEVHQLMSEANALIWVRAPESTTEATWGAAYLLEGQLEDLQKAIDGKDMEACEAVSAPLGVAMAVLDGSLEHWDDLTLHAASRLLEFAKGRLDAEVWTVRSKGRGASA